jgi:hypothetical protein
MARPIPDEIARTARPFLRDVVELAAEGDRSPGDFILPLGKYSSEQTFLIPRSSMSQIVERAKTEAARRKCERLLASPRGPHDLLVLVFAGSHVEGHVMHVPTIVREERPKTFTQLPPCGCGCGEPAEIDLQGLYYTKACLARTVTELREMGVPIEQSEKGYRLAPSTQVSFLLDGDGEKGD